MSFITLSKSAFFHNVQVLTKNIATDKVMAVLKDNAYGHGVEHLALLCKQVGIINAAVRTTKEAQEIINSFKTILVLSDDLGLSFDNVAYAINSLESLKKQPKNKKIHLKLDTGMHRNGIALEELGEALQIISTNSLIFDGVFSHLRGADELNTSQFWQEKNFENARIFINDFCSIKSLPKPKYHLHNSAGALKKTNLDDFDYIRPGIALYGYLDSPVGTYDLKPVLKLFANRVSSKNSNAKMKFGYGGKGSCDSGIVGIYDIGYADGFWRYNENHLYKTPSNAPLIGRVSMDSCFIKSDADEICLLDDAAYAASIAKTIPYDILVKLNHTIERKIAK